MRGFWGKWLNIYLIMQQLHACQSLNVKGCNANQINIALKPFINKKKLENRLIYVIRFILNDFDTQIETINYVNY